MTIFRQNRRSGGGVKRNRIWYNSTALEGVIIDFICRGIRERRDDWKMNLITAAICDRNSRDITQLRSYLEQLIPGVDIRVFGKTEDLLRTIEKTRNPYDVIFLRMEPCGMNGIEAAREIRKSHLHVPLILLSSSEKFYKEAFQVYAWQYLLLPLDYKALEHALYPLKCLWGDMEEKVLHYRYRSQLYTIPHSRILYISSNLHTVNFHLSDGTSVHCRGKLAAFEDQLRDSRFLRCHQSFFVNMDAITSMKSDNFVVRGNIVPISRSYSREVQSRYADYLNGRGEKKSL